MRLTRRRWGPRPGTLARVILAAALWLTGPLRAQGAPEPDPEDILGELVVEAGKTGPARLVLPRLVVESPLTETPLEARAREVVARDLELSGEFEVVPPSHAVVHPEDAAAPVDLDPWKDTGVKIVVRVHADRRPLGTVELHAEAHLIDHPESAAFERTIVTPLSAQRAATHRLVDAMIGALTGYEGPFSSRLAFVRTVAGKRSVYLIDPDGYAPTPQSPASHLAVAPGFAPDGTLYWAASIDGGRYRVYRAGSEQPLALEPRGSVYGLAFDDAGERVALSIATSRGIQVFVGPASFERLAPVTELMLAMHPAFAPRGALAYAGTARRLQRVYVDGKAVSPGGLPASAPVFCRHPDGTRLVYAVGVRDRADLLVADTRGRDPVRLTRNQGRNSYPACSPDGRLIAFFSSRRTGDGPGLYIMRIDGRRPRKISSLVGDSLQWSRRLPGPSTTVPPERSRPPPAEP